MADAARNTDDLQSSVGFFLNLLALRFSRLLDQRFDDAIAHARKLSHAVLKTSGLPFDVLLTELGVIRSSSHSPLFQAFMDYRQGSQEGKQAWADCELIMKESTTGKTAFDITLDVTDSASQSLVTMRVQKSFYDTLAADLLLDTYTHPSMLSRVRAIAEVLQEANLAAGARVLVFQQARCDRISSMLAIMRTGAVYVPMDIRNLGTRLAAMAADCAAAAILADSITMASVNQLQTLQAHVINISTIASSPVSKDQLPVSARGAGPAAILYTSGSTGTPKRIQILHEGLRNEIEDYTKTWKLGAERVLQQSAFTFDFDTDQIFTGLVNGGTVYIVPYSARGSPQDITQLIRRLSITYTRATPSEYLL